MKKLIIFDMDGVLVDACDWHKEALNNALLEIAGISITDEEHYSTYNGLPTKVKLAKLCDKGLLAREHIQKVEDLKQKNTIDIINKKVFKRQEKISLLEYLKKNNYLVACYTNSIRLTATMMLKGTGILNFFDLMITNECVKNAKPDPEGYNKVIDFFKLTPEETIIVEDSPKGIEAAKKTGSAVFIVKNADDVTIELFKRRNI